MTDIPTEAEPARTRSQPGYRAGNPAWPIGDVVPFVLVTGAAFVLYWTSSFILEARQATTHFGADTWYFAELARSDVLARVKDNYFLDRVARFHPATVIMAAVWMQVLDPLTYWVTPLHLLKAMFAAVGAAGVWAAMSAFKSVLPRGYAVLFGIVYAASFGVWYFSSIEESKIVTATLSAVYIASYLQLRKRWTVSGAALLTAILLVACLNEMVSGFLVIVPVVDTLMRHGLDWRQVRWIALHALAGPVAFAIIEDVMYGRLVGLSHPEGTSHFSLLVYYISKNDYSIAKLHAFVANWLFFNLAAPTPHASYGVAAGANYRGFAYKGYFEPSLLNYFSHPASAGVAVWFGLLLAACARYREYRITREALGVVLALTAYTLLRGAFFFVFNPLEPLLFSPAVTLAHLLVIGMLVTASNIPCKRALLGVCAALLVIANGAFILGR